MIRKILQAIGSFVIGFTLMYILSGATVFDGAAFWTGVVILGIFGWFALGYCMQPSYRSQ